MVHQLLKMFCICPCNPQPMLEWPPGEIKTSSSKVTEHDASRYLAQESQAYKDNPEATTGLAILTIVF
jgi:hypothetical protein